MMSMLAGCCNFPHDITRLHDSSMNDHWQSASENSCIVDSIIVQQADVITEPDEVSDENVSIVTSSAHFISEHEHQKSKPGISLEKAIEIAYADIAVRGIDAAYRSNSGIDREKGQWVWELLFRTTGERMPFIEYYINVENGNIVKFEWDD